MLVGLDLPSAGGGTEAGIRFSHQGNCLSQRRNIVWVRGETFKAEWETTDLWQPKWGALPYVSDTPNNREGPQAREPSKCLKGQSYRERLAKEIFWSPATGGSKKDSNRAITPAVEAVSVPAHLAPPESLQAKQMCHLHAQLSLGQSCHRQKRFVSMHAGSLWSCPTLRDLVDYGLPGFSVGGFSRQEYWSILANNGCHTLLEHYISCCPSHQFPWIPGAARTPVTQAAAPPPHLALTGVGSSPPGQPQEQTPVDDPYAEVEIKPQVKPRGRVDKEEDPKLSHHLYKLEIKSTWSARRLYVYGIYKRTLRAPTEENALVLIAVDVGGKNTQDKGQIRIRATPTTGSEVNTVFEGILGRWGGLWLPARERTLTPVTQEKHLLFFILFYLTCSVDSFRIFFLFPSSIVVVDFIGTMKSN